VADELQRRWGKAARRALEADAHHHRPAGALRAKGANP
jgi:hypothetical protein